MRSVHVNRHRNWCILFAQHGGATSAAEASDGFRRADGRRSSRGEFLQRWRKSSTGIRPGEKLYEELSTSDEEACPLDATDLSKAMRNYARISLLLVTVFNSTGDTEVNLAAYMHWVLIAFIDSMECGVSQSSRRTRIR